MKRNKRQFLIQKNKEKTRCVKVMFLAVLFACALCGCAYSAQEQNPDGGQAKEEFDYSILLPGTYDSKDTAVLLSKDEKEKTLTFFNLVKGRNYTLSYDGTTNFYDKYDSALALSQVQEGSIVDVTFLKNSKKLNTLQVSKEAWSNTKVSQFEINEGKRNMRIGSDTYKFTEDLVVIQDQKQMELMDINAVDVLTVNGIGTSIYSVQIEKGHGYLRLTGDEYVIGGWIEVGQSLIQEITQGMLLTVPEGTYEVVVSHKNYNTVEKVTINRNEETTLDLSQIQGEEAKLGKVLFSVTPSDAVVFVDGKEVDISAAVELEYGIHQLMVKAEGYKTSTSYLKVGEESAGINIVLDKADEDEDDSGDEDSKEESDENSKEDADGEDSKEDNKDNTDVEDKENADKNNSDKNNSGSGNSNGSSDGNNSDTNKDTNKDTDKDNTDSSGTVSGGNSSSTDNTQGSDSTVSDSDNESGNQSGTSSTTDYYKVYIDNPTGVEVYLDGNYVGIAPISFKKVSGTHVITLRKKGYETRSYTISVDSEKRDASYSFVDLDPEE